MKKENGYLGSGDLLFKICRIKSKGGLKEDLLDEESSVILRRKYGSKYRFSFREDLLDKSVFFKLR